MMWEVETTEEYDAWFLGLAESGQEASRGDLSALSE